MQVFCCQHLLCNYSTVVVQINVVTKVYEICPVGRIEAAFDLYLVAWQHGHRGIESGTAALSHTD